MVRESARRKRIKRTLNRKRMSIKKLNRRKKFRRDKRTKTTKRKKTKRRRVGLKHKKYIKGVKGGSSYEKIKEVSELAPLPIIDFKDITIIKTLVEDKVTKIMRVTYNGKTYVYKKCIKYSFTDESTDELEKFYAEKYKEMMIEESRILHILGTNPNIINIHFLVVSNGIYVGYLMEDLDDNWTTLNKICFTDISNDNFKKICEGFINALKYMNSLGLSISKIEHPDNVMVNIINYNIKLIDLDGIGIFSYYSLSNINNEKEEATYIFETSRKEAGVSDEITDKCEEYVSELSTLLDGITSIDQSPNQNYINFIFEKIKQIKVIVTDKANEYNYSEESQSKLLSDGLLDSFIE